MKKKLISYDAFNKIQESSLSVAEFELVEAADFLAKALNLDTLSLESFSQDTVVYETLDGTFVHSNYQLSRDQIAFENIQELEIDSETQAKEKRKALTNLVKSIVENKKSEADELFDSYLNSPIFKKEISEAAAKVTVSKPTGKRSKLFHKKQSRSLVAKRIRAMKKTKNKLRMNPSLNNTTKRKKKAAANKLGGSNNPRFRVYARYMKAHCVKEWANLIDNVYDALDYQDFGPALKNSLIESDEHGNVERVVIPTNSKRNEARVLNWDWMNVDSELKLVRGKNKSLSEDVNFCKAVADLKRYNNISDNKALEECLEKIVTKWTDTLYLTEGELAQVIKKALETANAKSFDDQTCAFMAEGILRNSFDLYQDKVKKIVKLAGGSIAEGFNYDSFKTTADTYYAELDQSEETQLKMFSDLHSALIDIARASQKVNDNQTTQEAVALIRGLESVINKEEDLDFELAETAADYISDFIETNLGTEDLNLGQPHTDLQLQHPELIKKSQKSFSPAADLEGDYEFVDPSIGTNGHSNIANSDTFPSLSNPYNPKGGKFELKAADQPSDADEMGSTQGNTWPSLSNPYVPKASIPKATGY